MACLKTWSQSEGLLLENFEFQRRWKEAGSLGGSENDVYPDRASDLWIKRNNLNQHGSYLEFFHRILLHNWLFPETAITFIGLVEYHESLMPIISQVHIPSSRGATQQETDLHMKNFGFTPIHFVDSARQDDYFNNDTGVEVNDLHDENVLIRRDSTLAVMDPVPMMDEVSKIRRISNLLGMH